MPSPWGYSDAMFDILVNDYRLAGHTDKDRVRRYVACHGTDANFERAWAKEPRVYTAQERAAAHNLTHEQFRRLGLRASGCNTPPQERKRLSRERSNAKRRQPGARTAEYARRTERRRAETAEIKRQAEAEVQRRMTRSDSSRPSDGVSNIKSLGATIVTVTKLESEDKTGWIRPRITESYKSIPKIVRIDLKPPETMPKERLDSIPFSERVELMQRYCGLGRVEAEVEAGKWLLLN